MRHCSGGKPPWECLKDLSISPASWWPRLQGCHSYEMSLINWSRGSFSCRNLAGAVRPFHPAHRELRFQSRAVDAELQGLTAPFSSAAPAVGDKTSLWDVAMVLDSQSRWIQNGARASYLQLFQNSEQQYCLFPSTLSIEAVVFSRRKWPMSELPEINFFFFCKF